MTDSPSAPTRTDAVLARLSEALASMRLAVVTMLLLAVACAWATFYESSHGTAAAQREFYRTGWFATLLTVLGINILWSAVRRYPWKAHQLGFVIAHAGILALLVGSLVSLHFGLDSNLALYEGETSDRVELLDRSLQVVLPGGGGSALFAVDLETDPPHPGHERRFAVPGTDVALVASDFAPHVEVGDGPERTITPAPVPEKENRRVEAVRVRLESPGARSEPEWILWTESRRLAFAGGSAFVAYRSPQAQLPFQVTLLRFNSDKYPGSGMAATYESWVRIEDPERGVSEHHVSMNHPLHYRGYIFFQSSFVEGRPMMSILSVTRAPGLPLVYAGVGLISVGVGWMFYLKPYLVRRQGRRALEARKSDQAPARAEASPVRAPKAARVPQPARGRA